MNDKKPKERELEGKKGNKIKGLKAGEEEGVVNVRGGYRKGRKGKGNKGLACRL